MLRIVAVCGFGVGSSMILKLGVDKALRRLGIEGEAETADLSSARGMGCDAFFTSVELAEELRGSAGAPVYPIARFMDPAEIEAAVLRLVAERGEPRTSN